MKQKFTHGNVSCQKNWVIVSKMRISSCRPMHLSGHLSRWSSPSCTTIAELWSDLKCDNSAEPLISPSFLIGRRFNTRGWMTSALPNMSTRRCQDRGGTEFGCFDKLVRKLPSRRSDANICSHPGALSQCIASVFKSWMIKWSTRCQGGQMQIFCEGRPAPTLTISGLLALFAVRQSRQSTRLAAQQILPPAANLGRMPFFGAQCPYSSAFWPATARRPFSPKFTRGIQKYLFTYSIYIHSPETTSDPETQNKPYLISLNAGMLLFHKIYTVCFGTLNVAWWYVKFVWGGHKEGCKRYSMGGKRCKRGVRGTVWGLYREGCEGAKRGV